MRGELYSRGKSQRKAFIGGLLVGILFSVVCFWSWESFVKDKFTTSEEQTETAVGQSEQVGGDDTDSSVATTQVASIEPQRVTYTVKEGDSLSKIASQFDTTTTSLLLLNSLDDANTIYVGQELVVRDVLPQFYFAQVEDNVVRFMKTNIDGSGVEQLMSAKVFDSNPRVSMSPDRQKVLFTESPLSGGAGALTYISNRDGSNRVEIVSADLNLPAQMGQTWSPDSAKIVYALDNNLWYYDLASEGRELVSGELSKMDTIDFAYAWDNDSNKIVFVANGNEEGEQIRVFDLASGQTETILADSALTFSQIKWPVDNFVYAIAQDAESGKTDVWRVTVSTGELEAIVQNELPETSFVFQGASHAFAFGVDSLKESSRLAENGVWYVDTQRQQQQLYSAESGSCFPITFTLDKQGLYFECEEENKTRIYLVQIATKNVSLTQQGKGIVFSGE